MIGPAPDVARPSEHKPLDAPQQQEGGWIVRFALQVRCDLPAVLQESVMADAKERLATRLAQFATLRTRNLALDGGQRSRLSLEQEAQ